MFTAIHVRSKIILFQESMVCEALEYLQVVIFKVEAKMRRNCSELSTLRNFLQQMTLQHATNPLSPKRARSLWVLNFLKCSHIYEYFSQHSCFFLQDREVPVWRRTTGEMQLFLESNTSLDSISQFDVAATWSWCFQIKVRCVTNVWLLVCKMRR